MCVVLCKHRIVVEAGRERFTRFTRGASYMLKYQLLLFHYKRVHPPQTPTLVSASDKGSWRSARLWQPRTLRRPSVQSRRPSQKAPDARQATSPASRTSAALPGAWGCSLPVEAAQHFLYAIVIKINTFSAATDPSREMNILFQSFILPLAKAAFICVYVLRKGTQTVEKAAYT